MAKNKYKEKILSLLRDKTLTHQNIAEKCGCSLDTVRSYTRKVKPALPLIKRLKRFKMDEKSFRAYSIKDEKGNILCSITGMIIDFTKKDWAIRKDDMGLPMVYLKKFSILLNLSREELYRACKVIIEREDKLAEARKNRDPNSAF